MSINNIRTTPTGPDTSSSVTGSSATTTSPALDVHPTLTARTASASAKRVPILNVPPEIHGLANDVQSMLQQGGATLLEQGLKNDFEALPDSHRVLAHQSAQLLGFSRNTAELPGEVPPFTTVAATLQEATSFAKQCIAQTELVFETAFTHDAGRQAQAIQATVERIRDASLMASLALGKIPVAELRADTKLAKDSLTDWSEATAALSARCHDRFGDHDPVTAAAQAACTAAAAGYMQSMVRMAAARVGNAVLDVTLRPVASLFGKFFGSTG